MNASQARRLARRPVLRAATLLVGAFAAACSAAPDEATGRSSEAYVTLPPASPSALGAADLANIYNVPTWLPANSTIAFITSDGDDPNADTDLAVYRAAYALPPCRASSGCLTKLTSTGALAGLPADDGWAGTRTSEMLDAASAGCPSCKLLVIELANSDPATTLSTAIATAKSHGASAIVSVATWAISAEPPDSTFTQAGITVFTALPWNGESQYPAASPSVISVGVTSASPVAQPMESASGAGQTNCPLAYPKPSWQHDKICAGRTNNDVSATGGPIWTFNTQTSFGGSAGWVANDIADGWVVAESLVAAIFAQTGNGAAGPSFPYTHPTYFNDVTTSQIASCSSATCAVGVGYDAPTGMGTPNGENMAQIDREALAFGLTGFSSTVPTIGPQGTATMTIEAGETLTSWAGAFEQWAAGDVWSVSFSGAEATVSGQYLAQTNYIGSGYPGATFAVTASPLAVPGTQSTMTISATAGGITHSVNMEINVTPCVPTVTSCGSLQACGTYVNNCGQALPCAACPSGESCSNNVMCCGAGMTESNGVCCPAGETESNGVCCPAGETESNGVCCAEGLVGTLGHCCAPGDMWTQGACKAPIPHGAPCGTTCK